MVAYHQKTHGPLGQMAEYQMRLWALGMEVVDRVDHEKAVREVPQQTRPFACVSREVGAGGEELAQRVADELAWQHLDQELLHYIAEGGRFTEAMLQHVDEARWNWWREVFGSFIEGHMPTQSEYVIELGHVLMAATRHAPAVIVGRGARFLLPRERGVSVRIIAPLEQRIDRIMRERSISRGEAAAYVSDTDTARNDFVRRFFHHDPADAHVYDLVINTELIDIPVATQLVAAECRRRFGKELA
jgi:cytidylate kinase